MVSRTHPFVRTTTFVASLGTCGDGGSAAWQSVVSGGMLTSTCAEAAGVTMAPGDADGVTAGSVAVGVIAPTQESDCGVATGVPIVDGGVLATTGVGDGVITALG